MEIPPKNILVLGSRSFASQGLVEVLLNAGHHVDTFNRGSAMRDGNNITGPVLDLCCNDHFSNRYDVIINYIVLKGCSVDENKAYMQELLLFCTKKQIEHLIHISSVSVYQEDIVCVKEDSTVEDDPSRKGAYGALKVAQEQVLTTNPSGAFKTTYVRPGFILGAGLHDPMVGMAKRLKAGFLLQFGSGKNIVPLTTRNLVNAVLLRLVQLPFDEAKKVVLVADTHSPARKEWLQECCRVTGAGPRIVALPKLAWLFAGMCGEGVARLLRKKVKPMNIVSNMFREMTYDSSISEAVLEMALSFDWREELKRAMDEKTF